MDYCKIIPSVRLDNEEIIKSCEEYSNKGADELLIFDDSNDDASHDYKISLMKKLFNRIDIPYITGGNVKRLEDVKKYLYAGASKVFLDMDKESNISLIKEASDRFGKEKIAIYISKDTNEDIITKIDLSYISLVILEKPIDETNMELVNIKKLLLTENKEYNNILNICKLENIYGFSITFEDMDYLMKLKTKLRKDKINVFSFTSTMEFSDFKEDAHGLIPVVVQDYKTNEVLMMAYMNEEAYRLTIETGKMTYYSRSRDEIWIKGLTSGHYQYIKELRSDCDNDTLLAKVYQVGAACHTGSPSCFYNTLAKKDVKVTNPFEVFQDVFKVILDRKDNPKEGSYTNYLFDKGTDKILKKLGEEATEIIIAAKNPDPEEIKYEISDFLYHMMVLMAERGVSWEEITKELARR